MPSEPEFPRVEMRNDGKVLVQLWPSTASGLFMLDTDSTYLLRDRLTAVLGEEPHHD